MKLTAFCLNNRNVHMRRKIRDRLSPILLEAAETIAFQALDLKSNLENEQVVLAFERACENHCLTFGRTVLLWKAVEDTYNFLSNED